MTFNNTASIPELGNPPLPYTLKVNVLFSMPKKPIVPVGRVLMTRDGVNVRSDDPEGKYPLTSANTWVCP